MPRKIRYDTEARQRRAIRILRKKEGSLDFERGTTIIEVYDDLGFQIATFDLSKFTRMRKPLKGVRKLQREIKKVVR